MLVGEYEELASKIPTYSRQFLYHLHLEPGKRFSIALPKGWEQAVFLPVHDATVNDAAYKKGDLLVFDMSEGTIEIERTPRRPPST